MRLYYLALWTCIVHIIKVNTFLLQDSYNIQLMDNGVYNINEYLNGDDYEMIKADQLNLFRIDNKENKLFELNKSNFRIARKEYERKWKTKNIRREWFTSTQPVTANVTDTTVQLLTVDLEQIMTEKHTVNKINTFNQSSRNLIEYNYNYLIQEYYDETAEESAYNKTFHVTNTSDSDTAMSFLKDLVQFDTKTRNCTEEEIKHIGFKALNCLINDYKSDRQAPRVLVSRLWRITKIWFLMYLVIAIPLWCTRGWCCCCLFCKFFKPRHTIEEAKKYLITNPPGVYKTRNRGETQYDPSGYEVDSYEKLEHLIKTI